VELPLVAGMAEVLRGVFKPHPLLLPLAVHAFRSVTLVE
jgi:hypothetical protein